jgi:hypothetical protein
MAGNRPEQLRAPNCAHVRTIDLENFFCEGQWLGATLGTDQPAERIFTAKEVAEALFGK